MGSPKWKTYSDSTFSVDSILMGYKGKAILDTGFAFGNYVPFREPSIVDRIAALDDPAGELATRINNYDRLTALSDHVYSSEAFGLS